MNFRLFQLIYLLHQKKIKKIKFYNFYLNINIKMSYQKESGAQDQKENEDKVKGK